MGAALLQPQRPVFEPGVRDDLPAADYHAIEALSSSGIKKLLRSPAHYIAERTKATPPSESMLFGTAVHMGVLEPERFGDGVVVSPKLDRRTKIGKAEAEAFEAAHAGKIVLDRDDYEHVRRVVDAIQAHPGAQRLLEAGRREVSLQWVDARYQVPCKARYDFLRDDCGIVDLKTTRDASREAFARDIASFGYAIQAAHYFSGAEHLLNRTPAFWAFIAAEKEPPYGVACYVLEAEAIAASAILCDRALRRYRDCLAAGRWPAYPDTIEPITLPRWAFNVLGD